MKALFKWTLTVLLLSLTAGCSSMKIQDYANETPKLDLFAFFNGKTQAWGQFQDRSGMVLRRFTVDITGTLSADKTQLILDEQFLYNDGEKQTRVWTIKQTQPNQFIGTAADVVGEAKGQSAGNALNWAYVLDLPYKDSSIHVNFDDWMYLHDDQTMVNRAAVTKWGFKVGEVTLFFRKPTLENSAP
ncbi:DUF3833 domain-containing protein [Thiosulfativibrio zosterae]|uniref:Lipoprotein n=1 Tax=Thiosulfativibrio zosterae TaxID=2675053 RepID=A0A6F8PMA2_9GAMM|nr:DUF3833 domain-containing protein [Thiosulfativibrio zosterae]BBP43174.1 hypothetical protein THMIRHAT_09200 [Thiosulfativibrio zosterae]